MCDCETIWLCCNLSFLEIITFSVADVTRTNANGDGIMDNVRSAVLDLGSRSSLNRSNHEHLTEEDHWEMNYHEAAIYLEV